MKVGDYVAIHPPWGGNVRCGLVIAIRPANGQWPDRKHRTPKPEKKFISVRLDSGEVFHAVDDFVDVISEIGQNVSG